MPPTRRQSAERSSSALPKRTDTRCVFLLLRMKTWKKKTKTPLLQLLVSPTQVFFVESICDDPEIIAENIKVSVCVCVCVCVCVSMLAVRAELRARSRSEPKPGVLLVSYWLSGCVARSRVCWKHLMCRLFQNKIFVPHIWRTCLLLSLQLSSAPSALIVWHFM